MQLPGSQPRRAYSNPCQLLRYKSLENHIKVHYKTNLKDGRYDNLSACTCTSHYVDLTFYLPEFSVLVDVSTERNFQISAVGDDDICSLYQFTISSANAQPIDRGEHTYLNRSSPCIFTDIFCVKNERAIP